MKSEKKQQKRRETRPEQSSCWGDGCVVKAAAQKEKRGTVPVCKERSLPFVFGLEEEE